MGFAAAASSKPSPTMLLLARFSADQADKAVEAVRQGADVLLFEGDVARLRGKIKEMEDTPAGVFMEALSSDALTSLKEAGVDFVVFKAETTAAEALLDEQCGFVLALEPNPSDTVLRILKDLPLDALVLASVGQPLTVQRQLELRRMALLSQIPLLVEVPSSLTAAHLRSLRDAETVGVIVEGAAAMGRLAELRQAIDGLPPRSRRGREERPDAMLPAATPVVAGGEEEEEDE